jgi:hypothetical protein
VRSTAAQIGLDLSKDLVVLQQPIEFGQLRLEAQLQHGHKREQVDGRGAIS